MYWFIFVSWRCPHVWQQLCTRVTSGVCFPTVRHLCQTGSLSSASATRQWIQLTTQARERLDDLCTTTKRRCVLMLVLMSSGSSYSVADCLGVQCVVFNSVDETSWEHAASLWKLMDVSDAAGWNASWAIGRWEGGRRLHAILWLAKSQLQPTR